MDRVAAKGQRGKPGNFLTRSASLREKTVGKKERRAAKKVKASDHSPQDGKLKRKEYEAKLEDWFRHCVDVRAADESFVLNN